ncbi:pseudouridylate synthase TRUB1 isoform X1 [Scleropages formosus]|uniref:pseudouridylate synthase TRUB1 isoform X1 n=1 Tax=Scleropages formosus TaxID=113540 RepID=UPI000878511D|nr:probable tRNA pseudouridine synthase 1 isoform X1 [Scleropages formosus]
MATGVSGVVAAQRCSLSKLQSLNGLFAIYKKQGPTSADVLNQLKRKLFQEAGEKQTNPRKRKKQALKMGHGGTLDSAASGVLVVGVGGGTKMLTTMLTGSKKYTAVGELGKATDTLDATGTVTLQKTYGKTKHITKENMEEKLKKFTGEIMQVPPLYSALKRDGQRLSVLLKKGQEVEAKPARAVTVYHLSLRDFSPPLFTIDVECGGGFYVRSLVDDLGKELSSCAHVKELVRTKQGQFTLEEHALREDQWTIENIARVLQATPTEPVAESSAEPCPAARPRKDGEEQQGDDQGS